MRINNRRIAIYIETLYKFLFLGAFCSILLILIPIYFIVDLISPWVLFAVFVGLIILLSKFGQQIFIYDSDGEVLNIKTEDPFWAKYFSKAKTLTDFPKSKLRDFEIKKQFFSRQLILFVSSKRSRKGYVKLYYNISYLNQSEISDLKLSLSRLVKRNNEIKTKKSFENE